MGFAEGLLTGPTGDTQACRWEPIQVPLWDLGSGLRHRARHNTTYTTLV